MLILVFPLFIAGCGAGYRGEVETSIANEDWESALPHLKLAIAANPEDSRAWRELGRVRLGLGKPDAAIEALTRSDAIDPDNSETLLYMGAAHEAKGAFDTARGWYESALRADGLSFDQRAKLRVRIARATRESHKLRAAELMKQPNEISPNTVAVYDFTPSDTTSPYAALSKGLAAMLITDLSNVSSIRLVERLQTQALVQEMQRSAGSTVDEATRIRAGRMLGAARSVSGSLNLFAGDEVEALFYVVRNESGEYAGTGSSRGAIAEVLRLEKEIAYGTIEGLGITLTDSERARIGKIPTTSFPAFLAFSQGIDLEDRYRYLEALRKYEQAVRLDPNFEEARTRLTTISGTQSNGDYSMDTDQFLKAVNTGGGATRIGPDGSPGLGARQVGSTASAGGFAERNLFGIEPGSENQNTVIPPVGAGAGGATITVTVPVRSP
ncbi:MAG: tetratricopeptide repeat protein [Gemmatimonadetes bacterium]|nr:tetratricopeptide repeat protein [Gemmatimonadota bacterium]